MWINGACISRGEVGFYFIFGRGGGGGGEAKFGAVSAVTGSPL